MAAIKLVCPNCGHDGTPETSRPPLSSYGFNYLAEGLVCREVRGYDESGRPRLSSDIKFEDSQAANARIECRSCWRTFPVPEGIAWAIAPEESHRLDQAGAPLDRPAPEGAWSPQLATDAISQALASIVRYAVEDATSATTLRIAKLEASLADQAHIVEDVPPLRTEAETLREQTASLARAQEQAAQATAKLGQTDAAIVEQLAQLREMIVQQAADAKERAEALDSAHWEAGQARSRLGEVIAQLEVGEQASRKRLDAQADIIRGLHSIAQDQVTRMTELREAFQRLEEVVSSLGQ